MKLSEFTLAAVNRGEPEKLDRAIKSVADEIDSFSASYLGESERRGGLTWQA